MNLFIKKSWKDFSPSEKRFQHLKNNRYECIHNKDFESFPLLLTKKSDKKKASADLERLSLIFISFILSLHMPYKCHSNSLEDFSYFEEKKVENDLLCVV